MRFISQRFLTAIILSIASFNASSSSTLNGPLQISDLSPFSIGRINMKPIAIAPQKPGTWNFDLGFSQANNFITSGSVQSLLARRGLKKQPLTESELQQLANSNRISYLFDTDISQIDLRMKYQLNDNFYFYSEVNYFNFNKLHLDGLVDNFHSFFGLTDNSRQFLPDNQSFFFLSLGSDNRIFKEQNFHSFGNVIFGTGFKQQYKNWNLATEIAYKINSGRRNTLFQGMDNVLGTTVAIYKSEPDHVIYYGINYERINDVGILASIKNSAVIHVTGSYEQMWTEHLSWIVQGAVTNSSFRNNIGSQLSQAHYWASLGLRLYKPSGSWEFALTENIKNFENSADISFHLGWSYQFSDN